MIIRFSKCRVEINDKWQHLKTIFEDGSEVHATPNFSLEDKDRAQSLGYGDDLWLMTIEHEIGHTVLAQMDYEAGKLSEPISPALWKVAHPHEPRDKHALQAEEARVLEMQKFHRYMSAKLSSQK